MPYKSKRTRDLQGEVVAGSGITITEQTKPDGTKEYTITNGDPASAITVDGTGLSLINNVLRNTMAGVMGWSGDDSRGVINWTDDNGDTVLKIIPLEELFIGDAHDNNDFIIKHINGENRLIRGTLQRAEDINSTEGVSLQTLADMSNSAAKYELDFIYIVAPDTNKHFILSSGNEIFSKSVDYIFEETPYMIGGDNLYGLKMPAGIYQITSRIAIAIDTTKTEDLNLNILLIDNDGNYSIAESYVDYYYTAPDTPGTYYAIFNINTSVNITDDNTYLSIDIYTGTTEITSIYTFGDAPFLNIHKIG